MLPMLQGALQIPRAGFEIRFRIEKFFHAKILHAGFRRAHSLAALFAHLHQTALARRPELLRIKTALAPDHRLDQHRIDLVLGADVTNQLVVLLKARRADPFVKCVDRIARSVTRNKRSPPLPARSKANNEFEKKSGHAPFAFMLVLVLMLVIE